MKVKVYLFSTSEHPNAISVNSLDIKLLKPEIKFSNYDYLIITSKQASEVLKQYDIESYKDKKALCVSSVSALSFKSISGTVLEVGEGYGDTLIEKIITYPKETKWLYLRAKTIASDFVSIAKSKGYNIDEIIVYESRCSKKIKNTQVEKDAILIFTSPSSVKCFLEKRTISKLNRVIVIGKTTAKALPVGVNYTISEDTTIESCMKIIS